MQIDYNYAKKHTFSCARYQQESHGPLLSRLQRIVAQALAQRTERDYKCTLEELEEIAKYLKRIDPSNNHEGRSPLDKPTTFSSTEILNAGQYDSDFDVLRYLVYRYKFKNYPRERKLNSFPIVLAVEPTSICNLRCVMCFQADETFTRDKKQMGLMDFNLYQRIIDEAAEAHCASVVLASRGEPLLHPRFTEMVAYTKKKGILDIKINTNATKLTAERARKLLEIEPNVLIFSVDSSHKEEFEAIRIGADFNQIVSNIRQFNQIRANEFPHSRVRTRISMVLINPQQDTEKAHAFWSDLVDEFAVKGGMQRLDIYNLDLVESTDPCSLFWERLYVWWDGQINPCDSDYKSLLSPGRISGETTIASIWQGEVMNSYRQKHLEGLKNSLYPCSKCDGYCL
ncbi:MAG: radical SAM protein [Deltaproteobacteria bacterium]|nr:radical SAM protein [Deltaproteobacteria bacterium]